MKLILKPILIMFAIICGLALLTFSACGENQKWDCPECGRTGNTGNYCGGCAHPAPWIETTASSSPTSTPKLTSAPTPKQTPVPLHFDEIGELNLHPSEDFSLHVTWSGGVGPYELCCYHYFNENHNAGISRCMEKYISYDNRKIKNGNSGITAVNATGANILHMGTGQTYWIVVKDSKGNSAWEKYTVPRFEFADFTAKLAKLELKRCKESMWTTGATVKTLKAEDIVSDILGSRNDDMHFGFHITISLKGFSGDDPYGYSFNYILILPNGDEYVSGWGFPGLEKRYTSMWFAESSCFREIYECYHEVPTGTYKLIATINGYIVGEKEFKIE